MGKRSKVNTKRLEMKSAVAKIKKDNPFDRKFERPKHKVLNRKSKAAEQNGSTGRPGLARAKAIEKRKSTLLKEYRLKDKSNVFLDKRIGEKNETMSMDEKMLARFTLLEKSRRKKNIFQLGDEDDELLVDSALDPVLSDNEEDEEGKHLDAKFVEAAHFGGFMNKSDIEFSEGKANTRKEWIENMIAESKKRKADKQKEAEEAQKKTKTLDEEWRSMLPSLRQSGQVYGKKSKDDLEDEDGSGNKQKTDSYDTILRELFFEKGKQQAKDRLKTEEEIIKEDRERLEKLEAERLKRMKGELPDEEESDSENESAIDEAEEAGIDQEAEEEEGEEESEDEGEDDSDLESENDEDVKEEVIKHLKKTKATKSSENKLEIMEQAKHEIPYTFKVPENYEELENHLEGRSPGEHAIIMERIIKCNHPQFGGNNREKLQSLFAFVLQYINDCTLDFVDNPDECPTTFGILDALTPFVYDLAQFSPQSSAKALLSVLMEKYDEYSKAPRKPPPFDSLMFLKLICLVFPTSDYRHPVVTPALQFMSQILSTCRFNTKQSIGMGIFVAALFTESLQLSKRFSPELLNFLSGMFYLAQKSPKDPFVPPFGRGADSDLFCDKLKKINRIKPEKLSLPSLVKESEIDQKYVVSCLSSSADLLLILVDLWRDLDSASEAFDRLTGILNALATDLESNSDLKAKVSLLLEKLAALQTTEKKPISREKPKPKILKLYEPEIEQDFDPFAKKRSGSKDHLEMSKLVHKMKREKKGAKKEIRADAAFVAAQRAKEAREKDQERIRKTKEILSGLGNQEGEVRKMQKKKKRMK